MCFVPLEYVDVDWNIMHVDHLLLGVKRTAIGGPIITVSIPQPLAAGGAVGVVVVHWTVTEVYVVPATSAHAQRRITPVLPHVTY